MSSNWIAKTTTVLGAVVAATAVAAAVPAPAAQAASASSGSVASASASTSASAAAQADALYYYRTWRTDGSLAEHWTPAPGSIMKWIYGNGTTVAIKCQVWSAETTDGPPYHIWDELADGYFVYDYYITTPAPDGQFSSNIPRCDIGGV